MLSEWHQNRGLGITMFNATMDFGLGEDVDALRETVRKFAQEEIAPKSAEVDRSNDFPMELWEMMGNLGLHGITISEEFGGVDMGYLAHCVAVEEISRANAAIGMSYGAHSNLCINQIYRWGNAQQKTKYLPKLISGEHIGSLAMSEPSAGSDVVSMKLKAEKRNDYYLLNGSKMWISNSPIADIFIIWAKSQAHDNKIKGFILEKGMKGLSAPVIEGKMSLRASITGEIILENVHVSNDHILDGVSGLKGPFECLNRARYGISWGVMGAAEFCWKASLDYGLSRKQFNRPLAQTQLWQKKLVDMQTEISLGLQACLRVGRIFDEGKISPEMISIVKRNNCGKALDISRQARDLHGGNGIMEDYNVMRHMCNLETVNTYEGTHDVHALILGRAQTGLQAFF